MKGRRHGQRGGSFSKARRFKRCGQKQPTTTPAIPFALKCKLQRAGIKAKRRLMREFYGAREKAQPIDPTPQPVRPTARNTKLSVFAQWPEHVQRAWKAAVRDREMRRFIREYPLYAGQAGFIQKGPELNQG